MDNIVDIMTQMIRGRSMSSHSQTAALALTLLVLADPDNTELTNVQQKLIILSNKIRPMQAASHEVYKVLSQN